MSIWINFYQDNNKNKQKKKKKWKEKDLVGFSFNILDYELTWKKQYKQINKLNNKKIELWTDDFNFLIK